jgi:hypothetical protein
VKGLYHSAGIRRQLLKEQEERMKDSKSYEIPRQAVMIAYKRVKANKGSAGIDGQSIE